MKTDDGKQPYLIERKDGGLIAMAGLWECNKKLEGQNGPLCSVTILTTAANQTTKHIHHRMPVIVETKDHNLWLDPKVSEPERFASIFAPRPDGLLSIRAVSKFVNSPRNDSPRCVEDAVTDVPPPQQGDLF
jgi:putative SOS response-associated peptidase YedK